MERVMIFIDLNNFNDGLKTHYQKLTDNVGKPLSPPNFDIIKLSEKLANGRSLLRTYVYTAQGDKEDNPEAHEKHRRFIDALRRIPRVEPVVGFLSKQSIPDKVFNPKDSSTYIHVEKETDVNIAKDLLTKAFFNAYDTAIIISADSDFVPVFKVVREIGKNIELVMVSGQGSRSEAVADSFMKVDRDFMNTCLRN